MKDDLVYTGMQITRTVDGERQRLDKLKPCIMRRIEMLGEMNDRWQERLVAGDREQLLELAREYETKRMPRMAKKVRREAEAL